MSKRKRGYTVKWQKQYNPRSGGGKSLKTKKHNTRHCTYNYMVCSFCMLTFRVDQEVNRIFMFPLPSSTNIDFVITIQIFGFGLFRYAGRNSYVDLLLFV